MASQSNSADAAGHVGRAVGSVGNMADVNNLFARSSLHARQAMDVYMEGYLSCWRDLQTVAQRVDGGGDGGDGWGQWTPKKHKTEIPEIPEIPGQFMFWGKHGWEAYSATHQTELASAYTRVMEEKTAATVTLDFGDGKWVCEVVLGELIEPTAGHVDIVGYQINKCEAEKKSNRPRWVKKVGNNNETQTYSFMVSPLMQGQQCAKDCRPPGK
jgi:hypothetical protein